MTEIILCPGIAICQSQVLIGREANLLHDADLVAAIRKALEIINWESEDTDRGRLLADGRNGHGPLADRTMNLPEFESLVAETLGRQKNRTDSIAIRRAEINGKRAQLQLLLHATGRPYKCTTCDSSDDLTIDHIVPVSKGGTDDLENLQWLCQPCNSRKGASLP